MPASLIGSGGGSAGTCGSAAGAAVSVRPVATGAAVRGTKRKGLREGSR
jgi:hypothetical protein